jgi:hypothetical protein
VILLAVMLKSCFALITDELLNNSSDKLIFMSLSALDIVINDTNHDTNNDLNLVIDNKSGVIKADNNITIHAKTHFDRFDWH